MITSKQRATLRAMANGLETIFQIGKGGIDANFIKQVNDALEARELIKLRVLENSEYTAREACTELCGKTKADAVQVIGTRFVLYRFQRDAKKRKIQLAK